MTQLYGYSGGMIVAVQFQLSARTAVTVVQIVTVALGRLGSVGTTIAPMSPATNRVQICLFIQKSTRSATLHTKLYVTRTKFVKMLESLIKVYYNVYIIGGINNGF